jgi:hypothetical protein
MAHLLAAIALGGALLAADAPPAAAGAEPAGLPAAATADGPSATGAASPGEKPAPGAAPAPEEKPAPGAAPAPGEKPAPTAAPAPGEKAAPTAAPAPEEKPAPPPVVERETAAVLIRRSMAAYGGSRARVRLGKVRAVGVISSTLHPGEVGRFSRTFDRGRGLRIEVGFTHGDPEVRILRGAQGFRYGEPAPAAVTAALQLEAARLELPALLLEREAQVQDQGDVKHEGQTLRVLGLELSPGSRLECGIEPKTGRILYVRGLAQSGPRELELFTVYRSFRVVDGVLVAFREEGYANDQPTGDVDIGSVEFPDGIPGDAFQP